MFFFLITEVSHGERNIRGRRETSASPRQVSYHVCAGVSLPISDVLVTCDIPHRSGCAREKSADGTCSVRACTEEFLAMLGDEFISFLSFFSRSERSLLTGNVLVHNKFE